MSDPICGYYDGQRYCRNKPYAVRTLWNGQEEPWLCRKHTREMVEKFERDNNRLAFYLRYRHLLGDSQQGTAA